MTFVGSFAWKKRNQKLVVAIIKNSRKKTFKSSSWVEIWDSNTNFATTSNILNQNNFPIQFATEIIREFPQGILITHQQLSPRSLLYLSSRLLSSAKITFCSFHCNVRSLFFPSQLFPLNPFYYFLNAVWHVCVTFQFGGFLFLSSFRAYSALILHLWRRRREGARWKLASMERQKNNVVIKVMMRFGREN